MSNRPAAATTVAASSSSGTALLALAVSILGAMLLTILAGTSDPMGSAVLVFVVGLWLLYLIQHPGLGSVVSKALGNPGVSNP